MSRTGEQPALALTLEGVSKRYPRVAGPVLEGVDLRLGSGELVELGGGNGSGKSTLLRIAAGLSLPTSGQVWRRGVIAYLPAAALDESRFTAYGYLRHMLRLRGSWRAATRGTMQELADDLGLAPGLDGRLADLSQGNRKKVLLMQALLPSAGLVLLDEPFDGLDSAARVAAVDRIRREKERGSAFVIASHTPEVAHLGTRLVLQRGTLVTRPVVVSADVRVAVTVRITDEQLPALPDAPVRVEAGIANFDVAEGCVSALLRAVLDADGQVLRVQRRTQR